MSETTLPATIQQEAKARALKVIEENKDCVSYVRAEDLETSSLFIPVVSVIRPVKEDFYDQIYGIGFMPKPPLINQMAEKAGVEILRTDTSKRGDYVYVGHAYGQKRQADGTMRPDDASYEFDCETRAKLDFLSDSEKPADKQRYKTDTAKERHLLELKKFGEQRCVTGAQHALIRKLAKVAASFKTPQEMTRGMILSRYDRNIDGMLALPGMQKAAISAMLGASDEIYGPPQIEAEPPQAQIAAPTDGEGEEEADIFGDREPEPEPKASPEDEKRMQLVVKLEEYLNGKKMKQQSRDHIQGLIDDKETPLAELQEALDTLDNYYAGKAGVK